MAEADNYGIETDFGEIFIESMYVRVTDDLKEPFLREIRSLHLKMVLKYFPILVLFFSFIAVLGVLYEAHVFLVILQNYFREEISETKFIISVISGTVLATTGFLIFLVRNQYNECRCWDYLYCQKCDAVDGSDNGFCPVCHVALKERASFYFIAHEEDLEIIKRWGLCVCKEA